MAGSTVAVVDYGMGNLRSVSQAVAHAAQGLGVRVVITANPEDVDAADRVVLPGQGAMRDCMRELRDSGLHDAVLRAAASKPLFGVCVGMQMLLEHSEEQDTPGLGLLPGTVRRFRLDGQLQPDGSRYKVPQMGWNRVWQATGSSADPADAAAAAAPAGPADPAVRRTLHPLWEGVPDGAYFYFVHSFHAVPLNPDHSAAVTEYGARFTCALARDNIFATQFHPEKSAAHGLRLYRNFLHWSP